MRNKDLIKKILKYIGNHKFFLFLSAFFAGVSVVLGLYVPILIGNAIDCIIGPGNVDFEKISYLLLKLLAVITVIGVLQWLMNVCNNRVTFNVVRDMRERAFNKIHVLPLSYLDKHPNGDIVSRVIGDMDQFADGLLMGFTQFFTGVVTIIGTLIFMLSINVWITLVVVLITPLSFFIARFIAKKSYTMFKKQSEVRGKQTAFVNEMVSNQKVAAAYSMEDKNMQRFDEINDELENFSLKAVFYSSLTNPATRFVNSTLYAAVALAGALFAIRGNITVGVLTCFLAYANQYAKPFNEISAVVTELQNAIACAGRVISFIEEEEESADAANAKELENVSGEITFNEVSFSYSPNQSLIENLNIKVSSGMRVAIVGPTGCGKTTLINLLMRFYDPLKGEICVDGINSADIKRKSYRESFGMVLQETWLKSATVAQNIKIGNQSASDDEVIEAAKKSHAHSFIKRLHSGYDTFIGEDGGNLSQGQKQLLCITRLMLCNSPMLILDEATSSIDTATEHRIQKAFSLLTKGRTTFIVAHRLSTIKESDLILVMNEGKIIEQGTHDSLLKENGFYKELYDAQFPETSLL